jgi:hypothetical protein
VLHVLTVHFRDPSWIEPQARRLDDFLPAGSQRWAILDGIGGEYAARFDHVVEFEANHPRRLNEMARRVSETAGADDVLMFLDGDAFPLRELAPLVASLRDVPLIAVRRDENLGDPQPHPCFALSTVGFWNEVGGDWDPGFEWRNARGEMVSDTGGNLLGALEAHHAPWRPLTRRNTVELHPVWFAVYGDDEFGPVAYHHGAGFRDRRARADRAPVDVPMGKTMTWAYKRIPGLETAHAAQLRYRQSRWERSVRAEQDGNAAKVFNDLVATNDFYQRFLA